MLIGQSILGCEPHAGSGTTFSAVDPTNGKRLEPAFYSSSVDDVVGAARLADDAFAVYSRTSGREKARFLSDIATNIEGIAEEAVARAHQETALPVKRLQGELARTANQLRMFARVVEEGSWSMARIDTADPQRAPLPRADIRSVLRPVGPVAIFGASNFPLAFSVAGGDTASALAAGNPVIVKAHPAHPGTSELVGQAIARSVRSCGLPQGLFSLLFDAGTEVGSALVQHPYIKAVGFTGSLAAGKALMQLAASRPEPIPCYAEMGSTNPLFVLPEALQTRGLQIAGGLFNSITLGNGQLCTKPGLMFLPQDEHGDAFVEELRKRMTEAQEAVMLTAGICRNYQSALAQRQRHGGIEVLTPSTSENESNRATAALLQINSDDFMKDGELAKEVFGPTALIVRYQNREQLLELAGALEGHLTATIHGSGADLAAFSDLAAVLERKAGRLIVNGYPTGVEVGDAMIHGGPYPATSDSRTTSVGSAAIYRFARPVCYQDFPQSALPDELKDENPLGIWRMVNGKFTRDAVRP